MRLFAAEVMPHVADASLQRRPEPPVHAC